MPKNMINKSLTQPLFTGLKIGLLGAFTLMISACEKQSEVKQAPPPPAVSVYEIKTESIGGYREFVARTLASKEANLRARVEGELLERTFKEGSLVKKDQVLLKIDPAEYIASVSSAKADLASAIAGAKGAQRDLKRGQEIAADGYISQSDLDKLTTNAAQTEAAKEAAIAKLKKAELDLSYTTIVAPFDGRIGKVNYNVGNVVGPNSDVLASLVLIDPIYVSFQVEESHYVSHLQKNSEFGKPDEPQLDISLMLPNNSVYNEHGKIDFADTKIDQTTGTVEIRAIFANPDGVVIPGLFVTLMTESLNKEMMSLIPQAGVQENQQGKFVLVVGDDNKVVSRHVELGRRINAMWVVESGLASGEKVIIEGLQKVKPGVEVNPVIKNVDAVTGTITGVNDEDDTTMSKG